MEVKKGYALTEIGFIPVDWTVNPLGDVCTKVQDGNYGFDYPKPHEFMTHGVPFLTSKAIGKDGIFKPKLLDFISEEKHTQLAKAHIQLNDVLFTNRGASVGAIGYVDARIDGGNIGPQLTLLRANCDFVSARYLFHVLRAETVQRQIANQDSGSAMNFFGIEQTKKFLLPLPPTRAEQAAIADALSDADAWIESLEQLIAKKRQIKQGAMQELLTGKRRLAGFSGEWETKRLGSTTIISKGVQFNKDQLSESGTYPVMNGGQEPSGFSESFNTEPATITISEGGNSCGFVSFMKSRFWCGGHCYALMPSESEFSRPFLFQALKFAEPEIMRLRVGSGLPNIQSVRIKAFLLRYPSDKVEQETIATVLSDMDTEIESLESKRTKAREIKQGMMQELLTGRIRLV